VTSIRVPVPSGRSIDDARQEVATRLRAAVDPLALGLTVRDVRAEGLGASRGATDFGEYFLYFSFFLVVSALLLAALFFKLGVEQRAKEVGLLRAVGFGPGQVRRLFLGEGLVLALVGSALGVVGAVAYAGAIMAALGSWWVDAVGTTALVLHVSPASLASGAVGGIVAAVACILWTLRSLGHISERSLLAGQVTLPAESRPSRALPVVAVALTALGLGLLIAGAAGRAAPAGAFFGAGASLLGAALCASAVLLRRPSGRVLDAGGWQPVARLGVRNATYRPGRSVLSIAVIACATFILVSVDAFRRGDGLADAGPRSGVGGYALMVETLLPVVQDPNTREGRDALNLFGLDPSTRLEPMRLLPGDDASCLNLYEPRNPRILAPVAASES
jgi:predicted lysophospholipase L1 biosynthesis ABC-type transport system permease subunit